MSLFLETLRIEQGRVYNLRYHADRISRTFQKLGVEPLPFDTLCHDEGSFLHSTVLSALNNSVVHNSEQRIKCRLVYGEQGIEEITYAPYTLRPVHSLQLVEAATLDYSSKSLNRDALNQAFEQRGEADEVLITQNGYLTDTSIANVALFDGAQWITPKHPLLAGIKRAELLERKLIVEGEIHREDLPNYSHIRCFNAMIEWGEFELPISAISSR
ncbi:MAG: aminotransferase class IV [Phocaeicola sp.]